jgi:hypothetical protein
MVSGLWLQARKVITEGDCHFGMGPQLEVKLEATLRFPFTIKKMHTGMRYINEDEGPDNRLGRA